MASHGFLLVRLVFLSRPPGKSREGVTVYVVTEGPARFKLRTDRYLAEEASDWEPIVLRCVLCPGWHRRTTRAERERAWTLHVESERHRRRLDA